jgi:hypothetical protein
VIRPRSGLNTSVLKYADLYGRRVKRDPTFVSDYGTSQAVLFEDKNELLRQRLHESGVSKRDLAESWKETEELRDVPFVIKLRAGLRHLLDLAKLPVDTIVLVFLRGRW